MNIILGFLMTLCQKIYVVIDFLISIALNKLFRQYTESNICVLAAHLELCKQSK